MYITFETDQIVAKKSSLYLSLLFFIFIKNIFKILVECFSKEEIMEKTCKIYELTKMMKNQEDETIRLKKEVVNMTKLADAAHTREQNAQEVIENLRLNITKMGLEIDQKNKQLAAEKE